MGFRRNECCFLKWREKKEICYLWCGLQLTRLDDRSNYLYIYKMQQGLIETNKLGPFISSAAARRKGRGPPFLHLRGREMPASG